MVMSPLVPVRLELSVAVTAWVVPAVVPVVKVTDAMPAALVVEVGEPNRPPAPVFDQLTVLPAAATGIPFESESWAVIVTAEPAAGLAFDELTTYLDGTGVKATVALPPIGIPPIVPATFPEPGEVAEVSVAA